MTLLNLSGLQTALGVPEFFDGLVTFEYVAGGQGFIEVDGDRVVLPTPFSVEIRNGVPVTPLELQPTRGLCALKITVSAKSSRSRLRRWVAIPNVAAIDFGDLVDVDPKSFAPIDPTPTLVQTIDQRVGEYLAANPADPAVIAEAVDDFLTENPPVTGIEHVQSTPSGSWVIAHSFGRRPAVTVYVGGEEVFADVTASATSVTVAFATPAAGSAVLN